MIISSNFPSLEEWLSLPLDKIREIVEPRNLAVFMSVDGTQRHYLITTGRSKISDFNDYAIHSSKNYVKLYDLLYSHGVRTILSSFLYPLNFTRKPEYLTAAIEACEQILLNGDFAALYKKWSIKARLYGDYAFANNAASARSKLLQLEENLQKLTPSGDKLLLGGFTAGSFNQEMIKHCTDLSASLGHAPTENELRKFCYPYGPEKIDIYIGSGWLRTGAVLPPLLDSGATDVYELNHLAMDLSESSFRRILYDHLKRRWAAAEDDVPYTPEILQELADYYREHSNCLIGTGHLVGPGYWYADHKH